jgi:hypothetical protein
MSPEPRARIGHRRNCPRPSPCRCRAEPFPLNDFDLRPEAGVQEHETTQLITVCGARGHIKRSQRPEILFAQREQLSGEFVCGFQQRIEMLIDESRRRSRPFAEASDFEVYDIRRLDD